MNKKLSLGFAILAIAVPAFFILSCAERQTSEPPIPPPGYTGDSKQSMEKYVSPEANFALYKPKGWTVKEDAQMGYYTITVTDPKGEYQAETVYGINQFGNDLFAIMKLLTEAVRTQFPDFYLENTMASPDGKKIVFDAFYTDPNKGKREGRCWISIDNGNFAVSSCETPAGQFAEKKGLLLSILSNLHVLRGSFPEAGVGMAVMPLRQCRLSDGSASFSMPQDWSYHDFGNCAFLATDPTGLSSFIVASVEIITPLLGVTVPGVPISPYLPPEQALPFLASQQGIATDVQFLQVIPKTDLVQQISQVYTAGPVTAAELIYTFTTQGARCKGYTFGVSFGSHMGTNWRFWHISVGAPLAEFDSYIPTFVAMVQSYKIGDQYAQDYIAQGMKKLQELQQQTSQVVARTREEISAMRQAAYDERQRSWDYIDYKRTNYIRGQQEWISEMEGGTLYRTDSWGTKNTYTGETWEGAPFDYVHFTGENPKYRENLIPIDSREVYERVYGGGRR